MTDKVPAGMPAPPAVPAPRSIATVSMGGALKDKMTAASLAGFDGIEMCEADLDRSRLKPREARRVAADLGLGIFLYQPLRDYEAVPQGRLRENLARAARTLGVMAELGATTLLACSSTDPGAVDDDALAAGQLARLASLAQEHGARVAYEALAWGTNVSSCQRAWKIVREAAHPALGICLDSFHVLAPGHQPAAARAIPGEKVFFLQLADAPLMSHLDLLTWSRHHRCFPGQGSLDVTGFTAAALAAGYDGPLSLEVFSDRYRHADPAHAATDGMKSLQALEGALRCQAAARAASPSSPRPVPACEDDLAGRPAAGVSPRARPAGRR